MSISTAFPGVLRVTSGLLNAARLGSNSSSMALKRARYLPPPGASATQAIRSFVRKSCRFPLLCWLTASTSSLVSRESVQASFSGRFMPSISGERAMAHSDINMTCSSLVKFVVCGRPPSLQRLESVPSGIMSASGQCPGPRKGVQASSRANCGLRSCQVSQKSPETRQRLALRSMCAPWLTGVSPGEVLKTMGRPH